MLVRYGRASLACAPPNASRDHRRGARQVRQSRLDVSRLVIVAAAEAANQVSYSESDGGSRVWALLYGCAKEVLSPAGAFANSFHGIRRRLLHLSVDILRRPCDDGLIGHHAGPGRPCFKRIRQRDDPRAHAVRRRECLSKARSLMGCPPVTSGFDTP
jgi:hypothetical protein